MQKILLLVIVILLACSAQAALNVRLEETSALLDEQGSEIIAPGIYINIAAVGQNLFAASEDENNYFLMNAAGEALTDALYSDIRSAGDILLAEKNGLWGMLDASGREITEFIYTQLASDGEYFWALKGSLGDQDSDELYILSTDGEETASGLFVRRMNDDAAQGRIAVQLSDSLSWGYCDGRGELVIPAVYSHAGIFRSGCAAVVLDEKYGAIDLQGGIIVPAEYDFMEISAEGLILASSAKNGIHVFQPDGGEIAAHAGEESFAALVGDAYAVVGAEQLILYGGNAEPILTASQQAAVYEGLNGQYILSDGAWGEACVSLHGTQRQYQNLYPLGLAGEGALYAFLQVNTARYMNDYLGEVQLAVDMDSALYGVVDETGKVLLPAEYESIQYVGDDRLLTYTGGLWQLMDSLGNVYWSHGIRQIEEPSF